MTDFLRRLAPRLAEIARRLTVRFDNSPLQTAEALAQFVRTRASYVAQTSLYGYLKARMGTSYRLYFEDERFSVSIRIAAVKLFLSCVADLTVFAVAQAGRGGAFSAEEAAGLARRCYRRAARLGLPEGEEIPAEALAAFDARAETTHWPAVAAEGRAAFEGSVADLAPFRAGDRRIQGGRPRDRHQLHPFPLARCARAGAAPDRRRGAGGRLAVPARGKPVRAPLLTRRRPSR